MSETSPPIPDRRPRARSYWRLLWLIPSLALLWAGWYYYRNTPVGGEVTAIKLTTKQGMVGQAAEAAANLTPATPDVYLILHVGDKDERLQTFKDMPVGNGLTWNLARTYALGEIQVIDVWDHNTILSDAQLDHITLNGWNAEGQLFRIDLLGAAIQPPHWALPTAAVGGALSLVVLLRFVWDQAI